MIYETQGFSSLKQRKTKTCRRFQVILLRLHSILYYQRFLYISPFYIKYLPENCCYQGALKLNLSEHIPLSKRYGYISTEKQMRNFNISIEFVVKTLFIHFIQIEQQIYYMFCAKNHVHVMTNCYCGNIDKFLAFCQNNRQHRMVY